MIQTSSHSKIISALMEVFDKPLSPAAQDLYVRALEGEDPELLRLAAARAIKTLKWMPKVSELRDLMSVIRDEQAQAHSYKYHQDKAAFLAASPWVMVETWERRSSREITPVVLDWQTCPHCGQGYANWVECPVCSLAEVTV